MTSERIVAVMFVCTFVLGNGSAANLTAAHRAAVGSHQASEPGSFFQSDSASVNHPEWHQGAPRPLVRPFADRHYLRAPLHGEPPVKLFLCDFEAHDCGMRNQELIGPNFKRGTYHVAGRPGRYLTVDASQVGHTMSRLITPYLPGYANTSACLSLMYIVAGAGADKIQVIAQDFANRHLFTLENAGYQWRTFNTQMAIQQDVRFFIEAYTTGRQPGVVAIDNFQYSFAPCPRDAALL